MARVTRAGISYFPMDVTFLQDIKIRRILKNCGVEVISVILCLFCTIYREEGYFMNWNNNDISFLIAEEIGIDELVVNKVVNLALNVNLFDPEMYSRFGILTSLGIQKRYAEACARRKNVCIKDEYNLTIKNLNVDNEGLNVDKSTQRKRKERKGNEKKGEREDARARETKIGRAHV